MATVHELKVWPEFFKPLHLGDKPFEVRYNDRDYKSGDALVLREFDPCRVCMGRGQQATLGKLEDPFGCEECNATGGLYTGRKVRRVVSYVLANHPALLRGNVILGLHIGS